MCWALARDGFCTDPSPPSPQIADTENGRIREIANGDVRTVAGGGSESGTTAGFKRGTSTNAVFNNPKGIAVDADGIIYVADTDNGIIRTVHPTTSTVTELAGGGPGLLSDIVATGYVDGQGTNALFTAPVGIAVSSSSSALVYVVDESNRVRTVVTTAGASLGVVATRAGGGAGPGSTAGFVDGSGTVALFTSLTGIAVNAAQVAYVTDASNRVRAITPGGVVTTLAGGGTGPGTSSGSTDGVGTSALFTGLLSITIDDTGIVYVMDSARLRAITPLGASVQTLVGGGSDGITTGIDDGFAK